ncbi:MAG: MBL fold metallo-hydrolase [Simkaniaceae bacterium]|nr:MBL fold metallo-hydrolase [Simkaniaceae bacterium]
MKGFCPLASGSKGNALYFGSDRVKLLIDAGISLRAVESKLGEIGVCPDELDAILVTHEHSDHIRGLEKLASSLSVPVFANAETAKAILRLFKSAIRFKIFSTGDPFIFRDTEIVPFSVRHDTVDPVAFTLQTGGIKIGICTDLGFAGSLVRVHLRECDYLYLEANHEPELVRASSRPSLYKERVLSRQGHLSNEMCADLLHSLTHPKLRHVYLAHLSEECNRPETALKRVMHGAEKHVTFSIAHQDRVSKAIFFPGRDGNRSPLEGENHPVIGNVDPDG